MHASECLGMLLQEAGWPVVEEGGDCCPPEAIGRSQNVAVALVQARERFVFVIVERGQKERFSEAQDAREAVKLASRILER